MATTTPTPQKATATATTTRSRKTPSPAATTATVPVPRAPRKPRNNEHKVKDSKVTLHAHFIPGKAAMATLTPDKLHEIKFVSTYHSKDEQSSHPHKRGYQREPMVARFPGIGRYYSRGNNRHLIPALIASVRVYNPTDQVAFNKMFAAGDMKGIHKKFGKSVFSIVDGQHREGGLFWAWENIEDFNTDIPVTLYYGLHYAEEAQLFDDINTSQRKLPKALIEATKVHMEAGNKSQEQYIREVAQSVAEDGDSVWRGLVNMTGGPEEKDRPLSYEGIRRSTSHMLPAKLVSRLQDRKLRADKVAKKYWEMVSKACAPAWEGHGREAIDDEGYMGVEEVKYKIHDLAGTAALGMLGEDIITTSLEKGAEEEDFWSAMADLVSRLGAVDWEKRKDNPWVGTGAGFAGAGDLYDLLYGLVYLDRQPGDPVEP